MPTSSIIRSYEIISPKIVKHGNPIYRSEDFEAKTHIYFEKPSHGTSEEVKINREILDYLGRLPSISIENFIRDAINSKYARRE